MGLSTARAYSEQESDRHGQQSQKRGQQCGRQGFGLRNHDVSSYYQPGKQKETCDQQKNFHCGSPLVASRHRPIGKRQQVSV